MKEMLAITGPTGVGKTAYVDALLERFPFEVINMDSIQVYAFFRIGPGRSDAEHLGRRHLYGYLSPHETLDVASYVRSAVALVHEIEHYGKLPLFEGGSRTLLPALQEVLPLKIFGIRPPADPAWREARLMERVDGYFAGDLLVREIEQAMQLGYGDTKLMRDPLIYMQTRDYLAGKTTLDACKRAMVHSMREMQDAQLAVFDRLDITWVSAPADGPGALARLVGAWIEESGWMATLQRSAGRACEAP